MKRFAMVSLLTLFAFAAYTPTPNPGVVYEIETTDHSASPPRVEETQVAVEGRNISMDITPGVRGSKGKMIFRGDRGDKGEMVVVDHEQKSYFVMDDAAMAAVAGQVSSTMDALDEALKQLPKEQRDAIEKLRKQGDPGMGAGAMQKRTPAEVRKIGERSDKEGYPCVKYEVHQDGKKIREIWTTDWDNIDGGDEATAAFQGMGAFFVALWESMPELPGGADPFGGQNPYEQMNFENGFPVVTTGFDEDGNIDEESRLKSARRRTLDPAEFEPPSGYKRRSMGMQ